MVRAQPIGTPPVDIESGGTQPIGTQPGDLPSGDSSSGGAPAGPIARLVATADYHRDPYPHLAAVREEHRLWPIGPDTYALTRYDDVARILGDRRVGNGPPVTRPGSAGTVSGLRAAAASAARPISVLDPPEHDRVRQALSAAFPRSLVAALRPRVRALVDDLMTTLAARAPGPIDAVTELALPVPLAVISELLGVPERDRAAIAALGPALAANGDPQELVGPDRSAAARQAEREFLAIIGRLVVRQRRTPTGRMLPALLGTQVDGARLAFDELVANIAFLFVNGYHNTVNQITMALRALLDRPDQLARLRADPGLVTRAVPELMRFDSPIQSIARVVHQPVEIGGIRLPEGTQLMALIGAAHRDPRAFAEPDRLDIARVTARRPLAFGGGAHYCIGAALARIEVETLLAALISRFPGLAPAGAARWSSTFILRGLDHLPLELGVPAPAGR
ncbi:cytochrome P450 [Micromonospora sp. FIMYZ51]|uniref:cytochrome P450 n=1 Tax=Micromonospora sp. FIMYZ51 TaxID=3051832 RepID=UPI00311E0DFD